MACGGCNTSAPMSKDQVENLINKLIDEGKLLSNLFDCAGNKLSAGMSLVLCAELTAKVNAIMEEKNPVKGLKLTGDKKLQVTFLDKTTEEISLPFVESITFDNTSNKLKYKADGQDKEIELPYVKAAERGDKVELTLPNGSTVEVPKDGAVVKLDDFGETIEKGSLREGKIDVVPVLLAGEGLKVKDNRLALMIDPAKGIAITSDGLGVNLEQLVDGQTITVKGNQLVATPFDDTELTNKLAELENKTTELENRPDKHVVDITQSRKGKTITLTYTYADNTAKEVSFDDNDTVQLAYDDTGLTNRITALEGRSDKYINAMEVTRTGSTITIKLTNADGTSITKSVTLPEQATYDDAELVRRITALEAKPSTWALTIYPMNEEETQFGYVVKGDPNTQFNIQATGAPVIMGSTRATGYAEGTLANATIGKAYNLTVTGRRDVAAVAYVMSTKPAKNTIVYNSSGEVEVFRI